MAISYRIRVFRPEDLHTVVYINRTCLPENYPEGFFLEHYLNWPKAFLVAEVKGRVVGYVMSRVEWGWGSTRRGLIKRGHIISLAVLPEYRRRGIGRSLMLGALKALRDEYNVREVYLEVRVSNTPAIRLYESLGFTVDKRIKGYYLDGEDAYVMVLGF